MAKVGMQPDGMPLNGIFGKVFYAVLFDCFDQNSTCRISKATEPQSLDCGQMKAGSATKSPSNDINF